MTHKFEIRENTGWEICNNCGIIKSADGKIDKPCEAYHFDDEDDE